MEEAVVGSVVGATIQVVLGNLLSLEEFNLSPDFRKDLQRLKGCFLMIQGLVHDAEMQQFTTRAFKYWLKKLESVAFEADDVFNELEYNVLRNKMENNMKKKVRAFFTHSNPFVFRRKMAHKIKDVNEKLKLINQEARAFGLQVVPPTCAVAGWETDPSAADRIVVGREDDVSGIVDLLTSSPSEQAFSVLPIVGMGGLGKTTLARQIFHHEKTKAHFDKRIWVYVSGSFDATNLFKKMLESLKEENVHLENRAVILQRLQQQLSSKRCLLVLDDLWNESREKWDDFFDSLSRISSVRGNGMIATTRGHNVASIVKTLPSYELKRLSEDNCWSIIKAEAFREEAVPLEFETIGRKIASRCQGLPLPAKVVGGLLCDESKEEWLAFEKDSLSNIGKDENNVLKVLKLSFDHLLSPYLKKCFAYCSIFPKGFCMEREQLIELWMAEGFLAAIRSNDMETVGNKFFNLLVQNSLLQVVQRDFDDNITFCNMHDLVHDLASSVLGSKSICMNDESLHDIHQVRYIGAESISDGSFPIPKQQARCVRTLILEREVSDNMLLDFKNLHALVLMNQDVTELPRLIGELTHLRLLDISETRIGSLPDSIGKLYHLQTLRARYPLLKLPSTLKNLTCLRHLHIDDIELPPEIGKLTSLQTLPYFQVGHKKGCRIGELGSLKYLGGKLRISNLERVDDKEEAQSACLFQKANIVELKFVWDEWRNGATNDENVLEGLQPHPNLKSLEICGFNGVCFPSWTLKMGVQDDLEGPWIGLNNLMKIRLKSCGECEEIPMLGHLPHLKSLYLDGLTNVRSIGSSFYGTDNLITSTSNGEGKIKIVSFPALERLELIEMSNLREWVEVEFLSGAETQVHEIVVFPRLERLVILNCCKLRSCPSHFPCLETLEIDKMDSALPLANICGSNLISLRELHICRLDGLVCLPEWLFCKNQNLLKLVVGQCHNITHLISSLRGGGATLTYLLIWSCPNLRELPDDLHSLDLLETLAIDSCPNLKSIPYPSGGQPHEGFTSLRHLRISNCEGLTNLPSEMIESCAPSLEVLELNGLINLKNLPVAIGCLQKMPRLTTLEIVDVPEISDISTENGSLHRLQELNIGVLSTDLSVDYRLMREFLNDIFKGLQSLRTLALFGMEHWESLPYQLQRLTTLSEFCLYNFGIEALPEWLGNMSSLQSIYLRDCKKLKRLPSKEAMQRLTRLTELEIWECSQLNVKRSNEQQRDDSQWPNISHIPNVFVDGRPI